MAAGSHRLCQVLVFCALLLRLCTFSDCQASSSIEDPDGPLMPMSISSMPAGSVFPTQVLTFSTEPATESCNAIICGSEETASSSFIMVALQTSTPVPSMSTTSSITLLPSATDTSPTPDTDLGSGSGSGSGDSLFPESSVDTVSSESSSSPTPTATPPYTYSVIQITLNVTLEEYVGSLKENFTVLINEVLSESGNITGTVVFEEQSSGGQTIVVVYVEGEDGVPDDVSTESAFTLLTSSSNALWLDYKAQYGLDLNFTRQSPTSSPPQPTVATPSELELPYWNWIIIGVSGAILIMACLTFCFACCFRSRFRKKEKERMMRGRKEWDVRDYWEGGEFDLTSTSAASDREQLVRKVSRISFRSRGQEQSHPLTIPDLEGLLANPATIMAEYSSIPSNMVTMAEVPAGAEEKNRYKDVLPNLHSRVALILKFSVPNSDYINANYIRGYRGEAKAYIATQGPLYWTVNDFWRMVWEQRSSVIIMTTGLEERGLVKCARYWPDHTDKQTAPSSTYDDLEVTIKRRMTTKSYTITYFHLRHKEKMISREVTHFWFTSWPDHGVPDSTQPVLDFLLQTKKYTRDMPGPAVVHCSAGIGRTGVFIGADIGMQQLEETGEVDMLKVVSTMRQDRGGMVQTKDQYVFLHQVLLDYTRYLQQTRSPQTGHVSPYRRLETTQEEDEEEEEEEEELEDDQQTLITQN